MHYSCEVCHVSCHSEASLNAHYGGKKHAANVEEERKLVEIASRSVFLKGFQKEIEYGTDWIKEIGEKFGDIDRVIPDLNNKYYVIIEFKNNSSAKRFLENGNFMLHNVGLFYVKL